MAETFREAQARWRDSNRISGGAKLRRFLRNLPEAIKAELQFAIAEAAQDIFRDASAHIPEPGAHPYSTGELKRKFTVRISRDGLQARVGSWGRRRAAHIHLVEFGVAPHDIPQPDGTVIHHPGARAQPFLFPAYKANRARSIRRIRAAVRYALEKAAAR
ncbi:HK97 gp10 family phage protein [Azospirillum sp.]|uniref:HK97 gp10 family phage protein n=1 Tax=Azospirillum sp. TaxID=34012 RepID=UPI003D749285